MLYTLTQADPKTVDIHHVGGPAQVQVSGTFGGATINMNVSQEGLPEQALSDFMLTEANTLVVDMVANSTYNFEAVSASGTTNINISVLD